MVADQRGSNSKIRLGRLNVKLSYEIIKNTDDVAVGYIILDDGEPWIEQSEYIPYPGKTIEESAELHINALYEARNEEPQPTEIELLNQELESTKQQLMETQDALIELADLITGGTV